MTNIELYINRQLCDIISPENLGIRLNRILLNPAELSLRDSQYSYSITIPSTPTNDSIFSYANVEEVKNKFNHQHTALLYIDSVKVFDGYFKLNEIDESGNYKGNLVVPAKKTVKEIFGDKKMNEAGEWWLDVDDKEGNEASFAEFISRKNEEDNPECIFPLVLYGLLPKIPKKKEDGSEGYTDKTLWDDSVRFGVTDFPPSINCMQAIRNIFTKNSLKISGSAFDDPRLLKLYMSYHNPTEYQQPWHWRRLGKMKVTGSWTNINNENWSVQTSELETQFYRTQGDSQHVAVNLFQAKNATVKVEVDNGNNIVQIKNKNEDTGSEIDHTYLTIPASGLYKVNLKANLNIIAGRDNGSSNKNLGVRFAYYNSVEGVNCFPDIRYEIKLLRTRKTSEFDMSNQVIDGVFYQKNQKGTDDAEKVFDSTFPEYEYLPRFKAFPQYFPKLGELQFIDQAQNSHFVCGLHWGKNREGVDIFDINALPYRRRGKSHHPMDVNNTNLCWPMAAKSGFSWDNAVEELNYCAIKSEPYQMYGLINEDPGEDKEEENLGYKLSDKFAMQVDNIPPSRCDIDSPLEGSGDVSMIVWLDKGERLSVVDVVDLGRFNTYRTNAYIKHQVDFELSVEPYRKDVEWIKVGLDGTGTEAMNWNDYNGDVFADNKINLMQFLPSEQKVDDWLNNFCKVFNLQLQQPKDREFELNKKQSKVVSSGSYIDLDDKTSLVRRSNQPLGMPSEFKLGFKINPDEEGYYRSQELTGEFQDGGGSIVTGNIDGQVVDQSSSFSYNWFKEITHVDYRYNIWDGWGNHGEVVLPPPDWDPVAEYKSSLQIPVITHQEIWTNSLGWDYKHHISKLYTNYSQRFWYKDRLFHHNLVPIMNYVPPRSILNNMKFALVSESLEEESSLVLSYKNVKDSILNRYFTLLVTDDSNYTYVECYLTSDEYERLNGAKLMKLNGDLYYVSAIEGYDPIGVNKTKLKLIRKI